MVPEDKHTLEQRSAFGEISDFNESGFFRKEIHLDFEHWQNIAENRLPWFDYNKSSKERKEYLKFKHIIVPCIKKIIVSGLTERQKEIITLYFVCNCTQTFIAKKLGISQPTVNQHLNGKKRNGKKIGGSIIKIRKIIRKKTSANPIQNPKIIMDTLCLLLDETISLRKRRKLIRAMLR